MKFDFKKNLPHIISLGVIILVNVFYFFPQFQGKVIKSGDITSFKGASQEIVESRKNSKEEILWTNSMFGGMPVYSISLPSKNNITKVVRKVLQFNVPDPAGMFILGMIGFYICLVLLGVNPWISLFMSIIFGFTTSNLMLLGAGHNTKVRTLMASAPIIAGAIMAMRGKYWLGAFVFSIFLALNISMNHPQMTYYLGLTMIIYMIFELVHSLKQQRVLQFAKGSVILLVGAILALGTSASTMLPTYEYGKETMRGKPILKAETNVSTAGSSSSVKGLDWNYAMNWSGGALDIISTFIPYAAGGGSMEKYPKDSKFAKAIGQRKEVSGPSYFGVLPSTAGPYYFGAIVFFLFVLGGIIVPGRIKWWLISASILTLLMSMGKNFELLNKLMFDYLPLFNKFRTPNSVLSITGILLTILAGLGLNELIKAEEREKMIKPLLYSVGAVAGFSILYALVGPSMISFENAYDSRIGVGEKVIEALYEDRALMMSKSAWITAVLVLISGGLMWMYLKGKLPKYLLLILVGLLAVGDSMMISKNYFTSSFVSKRTNEATFTPRPADKTILADKDPHFRIQDFSVDTYNSSIPSYFHKTVGGYSPAKLQRIQDVIDRHLGQRTQANPLGNEQVLNMMNTKYFIIPTGENQSAAQQNPGALGNAWFVEEVLMVQDANAEINALSNFKADKTAVVHNEFADYLSGVTSFQKNGSIKLTSYSPNSLEYVSNSNSDQLAVFSEVWYGPDLGWNAYIDDQLVPHIRTNYLLRALKVPAGSHTIRFEFKPKSYSTGKMISLISSILLSLFGLLAVFKVFKGAS